MLMELLNKVATTALLGFVISSMMGMGVSFTVRQIIDAVRDVRLVLLALLANFVVMPLGALALDKILELDEPLGVGLLLLGAAAGAPFLPKLTLPRRLLSIRQRLRGAHSVEQMLACMNVIMGGVMERFPRLRFAFLEGQCGWLPFWLGRMDEHYEWREPYGEMTTFRCCPRSTSGARGSVRSNATKNSLATSSTQSATTIS